MAWVTRRHASQDTNRRDRAEDQILVATESPLNGGTADLLPGS